METKATRIGAGGRLVIPANYRRKLGVKVGDEVILRLDDNELRICARAAAVRKAQLQVRRYVPERRSLVRELLDERRAEASRG